MALTATHKDTSFSVGDVVKVFQKIKEKDKERLQAFEGIVIGIKGHGETKTFTVRKIGIQQVGIERIYPLGAPVVDHIEVVRKGLEGVHQAKLYFIRNKSAREIEKIYSRTKKKGAVHASAHASKKTKKASTKKTK